MKEYHIVLESLCSCAKKSGIEQIRSFYDKVEAESHAVEWAESLNERFCGKHGFDVVEVGDHLVISVEEGAYSESCDIGI